MASAADLQENGSKKCKSDDAERCPEPFSKDCAYFKAMRPFVIYGRAVGLLHITAESDSVIVNILQVVYNIVISLLPPIVAVRAIFFLDFSNEGLKTTTAIKLVAISCAWMNVGSQMCTLTVQRHFQRIVILHSGVF